MAAFTGYGPEDAEREEQDKMKQDRIRAGLEAKAGPQPDASSPQGAASQGALGTPPPGGDNSRAFPAHVSAGGQRYLNMWDDASDEDKAYATEELEKSFGQLNSGIIAKTNETIDQAMKNGDTSTLSVAEDYGYKPEDKSAFAQEEMGPTKEELGVGLKKKPKWDRQQMGAFLTEMGFRILASNRDDLGGALGEAGTGQIKDTRARKREQAALKMEASERERRHKREAAADKRAESAESRAVSKEAREKLEKITLKNGEVIYADIAEGYVKDPQTGEKIREITTADLSASQSRIAQDNLANAKRAENSRLDGLLKNGLGGTEVDAIEDEEDPDKRRKLREAWIQKQLDSYNYAGSSLPSQINYSTL